MTTVTRRPSSATNGAAPPRASAGRSKVHLPYAGLAVLLIALGAIGFGLWASTGRTKTTAALAASRDISAGQTITAADLQSVRVTVGSSVSFVPADTESDVVGKRAAVGIPAGALLSSRAVRGGAQVESGQAIVSVLLAPGTAPVGDLRAGDQVAVVATSKGQTGAAGDAGVLADAEVVSVSSLSNGPTTSGSLSVSLRVPSAKAAAIADAAASDRVRLVLIAPGDDLTGSAGH